MPSVNPEYFLYTAEQILLTLLMDDLIQASKFIILQKIGISRGDGLSSGMVFQFKRYSIHDGPGIRTTVFLKGCPLLCAWCHNPESRSTEPQLAVYPSRCIGCGICAEVCPEGAVDPVDPSAAKRKKCTVCGICTESCPAAAREIIGRRISSGEVIDAIGKDIPFYEESDGGVTFSGGEPLLQFPFLEELLQLCRRMSIHTIVDTSCHAPSDVFMRAAEYADLLLCDIKLVDENDMIRYTGISGRLIMNNIRLLSERGDDFILRLPVVPGITDTEKNLAGVRDFILSLRTVPPLELLPYHSAWKEKCRRLGIQFSEETVPDTHNHLENALKFFSSSGIKAGSEL